MQVKHLRARSCSWSSWTAAAQPRGHPPLAAFWQGWVSLGLRLYVRMLCWLLHIRDLLRLKLFQVHLVHGSCLQGGPRGPIFLVKKIWSQMDPWGLGLKRFMVCCKLDSCWRGSRISPPGKCRSSHVRKPFPLSCLSFWGRKKPQTKHEIIIESTSTNLMTSACSAANIWALCSHDSMTWKTGCPHGSLWGLVEFFLANSGSGVARHPPCIPSYPQHGQAVNPMINMRGCSADWADFSANGVYSRTSLLLILFFFYQAAPVIFPLSVFHTSNLSYSVLLAKESLSNHLC